MLQAIRSRSQGWIAWVIVGLIILTFALFGIDQYARGDRAVAIATVNGEDITATEFLILHNRQQTRLKQQFGDMYDQIINESDLRQEVLNALIESKVVGQWAADKNMLISDQQLATAIQTAPVFQVDGKFDKELYTNILLRNNLSVARFEYEQRQYLIENQFRQLTMSSGLVLPHQVERLIALQLQERNVNYLRVDQRPFKDTIEITEQQIIAFYEKNKDAYIMPEQVKIDYIVLSRSDLAARVSVTPEDLEQFFNDHKMSFSTLEKRQASHILIRTGEGISDEDALKAIQSIEAEIRAGKDFVEIAKEQSQDPGSAQMGGDLGLFQQGMMVPEFDDAVFDLNLNDMSPPIKTEFGYHLIKVTKIEPRTTRDFADVKETVAEQFREQEADRMYFDLLEQMNALAFENPDTLTIAAEDVGLTIVTSEAFSRQGGVAEIVSNPRVIVAAFSEEVLKAELNSPSIELSSSSSVILRLNEHIAERQKPLEEVKPAIIAELTRQVAIEASAKLANEILAKVNAGEALKLHEKSGVEWSVEGWLNRENHNVLPQITAAVFKMRKPQEGISTFKVMQLTTGDSLVLELSGVRQSEQELTPQQKAEVNNSLTVVFTMAEVESRIKSLVAVADVEVKVDLLTIR